MVSFTLTEVETDTETEKYMACMKLYRRVHTDRDPLTIEYNGVSETNSASVNDPYG